MRMNVFHKLDYRFDAKLRVYSIETRSARLRGEDVVFSEGVAYIDALFDLEIFDHLHNPNLIGIERKHSNGENTYLIFEVIGVRPKHYEMPSLTPDVPPVLKWEYLRNIEKSWVKGGENWMEIIGVHTGYQMISLNNSEMKFEKTRLSPLAGAKAHILSEDVIKHMVCKDPRENYVDDIGLLIGYDIPLTVDIYSLFKYHTGIFGFTGSGKSNLISLLVRKAIDKIPELKIFIIDLAGEYTVHLLDLLVKYNSIVYVDEPIPKDRFADSQVIPESLSNKINEDIIKKLIIEDVNLDLIGLTETTLTIGEMQSFLEGLLSEDKPHIKSIVQEMLNELATAMDYESFFEYMDKEENKEAKNIFTKGLGKIMDSVSSKSNLYKTAESLKNQMATHKRIRGKRNEVVELARNAVQNTEIPPLTIFYIPNPKNARKTVSTFIDEIFKYKKFFGSGNKVLIVLDEAQEFIPDRLNRDDYTYSSNLSVEMLLRQGRKYFVGGWIATQRIAHLNTNALQQLHNYFVSTLPRSYDRNVVSDAFSISRSVIDKVTELESGEWLFVSYKATNLKNVPVELKTYNNEDIFRSKSSDLKLRKWN